MALFWDVLQKHEYIYIYIYNTHIYILLNISPRPSQNICFHNVVKCIKLIGLELFFGLLKIDCKETCRLSIM